MCGKQDFRRVRSSSEVKEDFEHGGQRPGLGLAAEGAVLAILIGQLRETLPGGPGGSNAGTHQLLNVSVSKWQKMFSVETLDCG